MNQTYSSILFLAVAVGLFTCVFSTARGEGLTGLSLPPGFRAFSPDSPWNTPIDPLAQKDEFSDLMIENLRHQARSFTASFTEWTAPLFVIDSAKSPKRRVVSTGDCLSSLVDPERRGAVDGIPIPEGVWPDPQRDAHMILVDPVVRKSWEFSKVVLGPSGTISARRIFVWDLDGPGYVGAFSGKCWWAIGAIAAGMPLIGGLVRPEEIEAGEIRHALLCATPINRKSSVNDGTVQVCSPPAARSDGQGIGLEYIPEGARLQLDPAFDPDSLGLSAQTKVVVRALQRYGMYNGVSGKTFKIFFQNLGPDGGKWAQYGFLGDLKKIPIERFRVLKCSLVSK